MKLSNKSVFLFLLVVSVFFVVAPVNAALADTAQPKFHTDLGNTGQSDYGQEYVGTQYTKTKWTSSTGGVVQGSPVIDSSGTIYITSGDDANTAYSNVYAVNPNTGAKIWQKTLTDNYADSTPAISDSGTVYVNTLNHVYALNPSNGATLYNYDLSVKHPGDSFSTSPTITTNGNIIIGGINGYIYALSPTLTEKWRSGCYGTNYGSTPAIGSDGTIYFGATGDATHPSKLVALNPTTGAEKWSYTITTDHVDHSSPAIGSDGTIYIGTTQIGSDTARGKLYAINPTTHTAKWTFTDSTVSWFGIDSSPAVTSGTIYFGSSGIGTSYFYALDLNGKVKWKYAITGDSVSAPAIDKNFNVYFAEVGTGAVYALSSTGNKIWKYDTPGTIQYASPVIGSDGTIYIGGNTQDKLFAIKAYDKVPPKAVAGSPARNAVNVPVDKLITTTFSESIKIGTGTIKLVSSSGTVVPIDKWYWKNILYVYPQGLLKKATKYTLILAAGSIVDYSGNSILAYSRSFTTDSTPPKPIAGSPARDATNVARNKVITTTFSEPIYAGNMWITLKPVGGTAITITPTIINGNVLQITHGLLASSTKYLLEFHTGSLKDAAGNLLKYYYRYFTTGNYLII